MPEQLESFFVRSPRMSLEMELQERFDELYDSIRNVREDAQDLEGALNRLLVKRDLEKDVAAD